MTLPTRTEGELAEHVSVLCNVGFSPTKDEVMVLVADY